MTNRINYLLIIGVCLSVGLFITHIIGSSHAAQENTSREQTNDVPSTIDGKVSKTISVPGYTYVEVDTGNDKVWAAVPSTSVIIDDQVSFSLGVPMRNFYSKTLQRNFPVIYFVDHFITDDGATRMSAAASAAHGRISQEPVADLTEDIEKAKGGNTIAEIHTQQKDLNGHTLRVRGQVTKFTAGVLGKNWVHIRDSSSSNDLTVTTDVTVAISDIVIVEGKLELDKDFGYGYFYSVILQDARITKE